MAQVKFRRIESSEDISDIPVVDGQIIYTKDAKQYLDYETSRIDLSSSSPSSDIETILWENPNPDTEMTTEEITLSNNNYDEITWIFKVRTTSTTVLSTITIKGFHGAIQWNYAGDTLARSITRIDDTTYSISNCTPTSASGSTAEYMKQFLIPLYAVGKNTGLFGE